MSVVYTLNRFGLTPEIQASIDAIYSQILSLVKSQGKSFQITDVFSMISATAVAVNSFFKDTDTSTKVIYIAEIVEQVLTNLSSDNVIPSEIGFYVKLIPIKLIVEFIMKTIANPPKQPPVTDAKQVLQMLSVKNHTGVLQYAKINN
jgi:hypothetical protein